MVITGNELFNHEQSNKKIKKTLDKTELTGVEYFRTKYTNFRLSERVEAISGNKTHSYFEAKNI